MAWDPAHIFLTGPAASAAAAAAAVVVATAAALVRAVVAFMFVGAPFAASGVNFTFDTSRNCLHKADDVPPLGKFLAAELHVLDSRAGLEHRGDDVAAHFFRGELRGVLRQVNH